MHFIGLENELSSFRGGQELNMFEICNELSQRGHNISLIYLKQGNLFEQYRKFCNYLVKVNSYEFNRYKINEILYFLPGIFSVINIPVIKNSVVFCNAYDSIFFGYVLSLLKNIPFVCYFQVPPFSYNFNYQKVLGFKNAKRFISVSNNTKLDWIKSGIKEDKIDIVYNGTNTEKFKLSENFFYVRNKWNIPENTRVISYVGRLDKHKGLETLIGAFALLVKSGITAQLLIAGNPILHFTADGKEHPEEGEKYKRFLKQLSIDLGIEKNVDFLGHVADTVSLYQVSDVTVLPSQWSEPFGRVIIESMACGTPVVASRIGGIPEILTGEFQQWLFEPGNQLDLAETLNRIIHWRDGDFDLSQRCREHVLGKFTIDRMIDGIEKVLLHVAKH
jgi:glycosyltransferase involved in cell wall biosynthesis